MRKELTEAFLLPREKLPMTHFLFILDTGTLVDLSQTHSVAKEDLKFLIDYSVYLLNAGVTVPGLCGADQGLYPYPHPKSSSTNPGFFQNENLTPEQVPSIPWGAVNSLPRPSLSVVTLIPQNLKSPRGMRIGKGLGARNCLCGTDTTCRSSGPDGQSIHTLW